eukprot:CAMPEP_0185780638 /NCGR_PEP_ID=MMETSP1174-20130828/99762_1 /TAXON_ID=35687 /ORGANISM="Dictyocha speculum, Strain CCMP1381" /LENGTH=338 /DNA_ID=CAMNT_0028470281 /DNA_START=140 /DNA_END=1156 /DNA_ORIENTATION=-
MKGFSEEFEMNFLDTLSRHHNTKRVHANIVYKEYIHDKHHIHMNSTKWSTLSNFVLYLGKTGKCVVDETEKGWYISWIDRDPAIVARQIANDKKRKNDMDDEVRRQKEVMRRVEAASDGASLDDQHLHSASELRRDDADDSKVSLAVSSAVATQGSKRFKSAAMMHAKGFVIEDAMSEENTTATGGKKNDKRSSALEALMKQEKTRKDASLAAEEKSQRKEYWLRPGIVVKVMNQKVGKGKFYKCKGVVESVVEHFIARVRLIESEKVLQIDQDDLETVIPKVGSDVIIVNGRCRGSAAELLSIDVRNFCVKLRVKDGKRRGQVLDAVEYEDVCKSAE